MTRIHLSNTSLSYTVQMFTWETNNVTTYKGNPFLRYVLSSSPASASSTLLPPHNTIFHLSYIDAHEYRSVIGSSQYLPVTWPIISFVINKVAQYMHKLSALHWQAVTCLLLYLKAPIHHGLILWPYKHLTLSDFSEADWAGDQYNFLFTTTFILYTISQYTVSLA